jgi:hypothetical protein
MIVFFYWVYTTCNDDKNILLSNRKSCCLTAHFIRHENLLLAVQFFFILAPDFL